MKEISCQVNDSGYRVAVIEDEVVVDEFNVSCSVLFGSMSPKRLRQWAEEDAREMAESWGIVELDAGV